MIEKEPSIYDEDYSVYESQYGYAGKQGNLAYSESDLGSDYGEGSFCDVSLTALDVPPPKGPLFVFGIPFLQKFYTVYDHAEKRVGFASAKHEGQESEALVSVDHGGGEETVLMAPVSMASSPPESFLERRMVEVKLSATQGQM